MIVWDRNANIENPSVSFQGRLTTEFKFQEAIARIYEVSQQNIFTRGIKDNSFRAIGEFNDIWGKDWPFILYDVESKRSICIAGHEEFPVEEFIPHLVRELGGE